MSGNDLDNLERKIKEAQHGEASAPEELKRQAEDDNARQGMHAGMEFVGSILIAGLIGYWLDDWLGSAPGFFLGFLLLGICTGFYNVWRITEKIGTSVGYSELHHRAKNAKTSPDLRESGKDAPENHETEKD